MLALSTTAIVIIATVIGGVVGLAGIIGAFLLVRRRYMHRHTRTGNDKWQSDTLNGQRFSNSVQQNVRTPRYLSFERFFKSREKAPIRHPSLSRVLHKVLPSRQDSILPSDWAVRNGGHVPRPHRLKKSKCSASRDSWLLSGIGSSKPAMLRIETDTQGDNPIPKQARTTRAKIAKISGPSGKSHIVSMIVTPEYDDSCRSLHYQDDQILISRTRLADLRKSWLSSSDPQRDIEQQSNKLSVDIPGTGSSQRARNRRSMSLPFISSSRPPSTAVPPVPAPIYSPRLFIPKRANIPETSPSKQSFASRTTIGSSIFNGLSPSLTSDLRQISAGIKRPESRRTLRRRSSAPSLQMRSFLLDEKHDILTRRPSGASSQLLPSPARPLLRNRSQGTKTASALQSRAMPSAKISKPCLSSDSFQLRTRDTPISLIGLRADWDVFGYEDQMTDSKSKPQGGGNIVRQTSCARVDANDHGKTQLIQPQTPKRKVLQKKWAKQESYLPLPFASVPYSSTISLDTPLQIPVLDNQASSVYSVSSALSRKSRDQASPTGNSSLRSITSPFPFTKQSSNILLNILTQDDLRNSSPTPRKRLFGPRQMSPTSSRVSSPERTDPYQDISREYELKPSKYKITDDLRQSMVQPINNDMLQHRRYQFEDANSDQEHKIHQPEPTAQNPCVSGAQCKSSIDPPPVRLQPTPLRQSFYGYEAAPNFVPKTYSINNIGSQSITLTRPVSMRSVAAPRSPSSLSNNFRASVISQPVSRQSSIADNRLSNRGSIRLASPQSPNMISESSRPISTEYMFSISENDDPTVTNNSSNLENEQRFSASPTPLKNYSELCNLFPQPLSMNSGSRPPTWILTGNPGTNDTYPPSSQPTKPGLPPHPRYFLDQQRNRTSTSSTSQPQHQPPKHDKSNSSTHTTKPTRSPTRKGHTRMLTTSTQTTPSLTHHQSSHSIAAHIPAYQSDKASTLSLLTSRHHTAPTSKPIHRTTILEPISVNIGAAPTPFAANQDYTNTTLARYREASPSPSSQGSTTQTSKSHHGPTSKVPGYSNKPPPTQSAKPIPANPQLKQRIKQAQQRRIQAQAQTRNDQNRTVRLAGLGITIPPSTTSLAAPATVSLYNSTAPNKRKAESSTAETTRRSTKVRFSNAQVRDENAASVSAVARTVGKDSEEGRLRTDYRDLGCKGGGIGSYAFEGGRLSASPGRIWREECF